MTWTERLDRREPFLGDPDVPGGESRVAEAMGGLADDECLPTDPSITGYAASLQDHDLVHEAMVGMCAGDEL